MELTRFYLDRIKKYDGLTGCYLRLTEETALVKAAEADKRIREGTDGELTGIPFGMKDILCTKGVETTCASQDPQRFRSALRRDGHKEVGRERLRPPRQDQHGRICHGLLHGELLLSGHEEPVGPGPHTRRIERGFRGGGGSRSLRGDPGDRYRRLHQAAGRSLRRGRTEAHLREGVAVRSGRLCLIPRPDRTDHDGM